MDKQNINRSVLPKASPLHEEPIEGIEVRKEMCEIMRKNLQTPFRTR